MKQLWRDIGDVELRSKTVTYIIGAIVVVAIFLFSSKLGHHQISTGGIPRTTASDKIARAKAVFELKLGPWSCHEEYGYSEIDGTVTNVTDQPIDQIVALGVFFDNSDTFIKASDALIDYQPLLAGQTSPFKVMTTGNPAIRSCNVLSSIFGAELSQSTGRGNL